ncbi:Zinc/cadmium resistance protein [Diplodia seriata]|uniref:Zinc/cadmium resistance protein n=1 Tax=Diplodia seriata TaxID=420778 RepID=A0A1S8B2E9_9PEZI|nr:Zinc/cadmium resistance protein [Diplodia seriata]
MIGVIVHVLGDACNNVAVIVAALVIWLVESDARFYADPALSTVIAVMILASSVPLTKRSGTILLQSAPPGVRLDDVKHDLEMIPDIHSIHELHIWRLDQKKAIASAHVVVAEDTSLAAFMLKAQTVAECLHAYGIHSATLQPELVVMPMPMGMVGGRTGEMGLLGAEGGGDGGGSVGDGGGRKGDGVGEEEAVVDGGGGGGGVAGSAAAGRGGATAAAAGLRLRQRSQVGGLAGCRLACGDVCEPLMCCN